MLRGTMRLRSCQTMPLRLWRKPFDDPAWAFELKYDGFRALAFVDHEGVRFVSRHGHGRATPELGAERERE